MKFKKFNETEHILLKAGIDMALIRLDREIRLHCIVLHGEAWKREWAERKAHAQTSA